MQAAAHEARRGHTKIAQELRSLIDDDAKSRSSAIELKGAIPLVQPKGELKLPLFTIRLDAVIIKFMGETAAKLRFIFDAMSQTRGVYFFDEFDAIGARRAAANDVGEIRRVLNSFLQFLDQDGSRSLVFAATNHAELLDPALCRRFDDVIEYALPDSEIALGILQDRLAGGVDRHRIPCSFRSGRWRDCGSVHSHCDRTRGDGGKRDLSPVVAPGKTIRLAGNPRRRFNGTSHSS